MDNKIEETKRCKYCQSEIPKKAKVCPYCRKKQGSKLKTIGIVFLVIFFLGLIGGNDEDSEPTEETTRNESTANTEKPTNTLIPTALSEEEINKIKEEAVGLEYKSLFRNPDGYIGKYFVVDVKILTVENGSWLSGYEKAYKSYTNDKYDNWFGDMVYLLDQRKETDYGYVKILEDDIVRVWGIFDGLVETKNAINGTKGEEMSLNVLYTELLSE